ncbi:argininosuccinate synthase domain-containing protein [Paenibacillus dakarensis]|uniref:argininosuccinate synthase domain-containing protein n=1 Tax=Paenibacillus dakarensis TaxID=1527293 RepID=UPI0006D5889B|nr:argininosuccinate synthase domain-containing protein [Paenibacillus dakarensis]
MYTLLSGGTLIIQTQTLMKPKTFVDLLIGEKITHFGCTPGLFKIIEVTHSKSLFSVDPNLWGRSVEAGALEDPWVEPPREAFEWTLSPEECPSKATYIEISFEAGRPVSLNNERIDLVQLIENLNELGGSYGVGRIDHVENRLVGIKTREIYEAPAAVLLHASMQPWNL